MGYEKNKDALAIVRQMVADGQISQDVAEKYFPELKESEDEKIRKDLIQLTYKVYANTDYLTCVDQEKMLAWLEKQGEQKPLSMIQWKGNNLKEVIDFTGKSLDFDKWFKSWDEYEQYVNTHNNIFKLFNEDGSHYEVPVGAWIVKTPDGHNVPTTFTFIQKPIWWSKEDNGYLEYLNYLIKNNATKEYAKKIKSWLQSLKDRVQPQQKPEWSEEDEENMSCVEFSIKHAFESKEHVDKLCNWLKTLKNRVLPFNDRLTKECFIKALERVKELKDKGYELTLCDKETWYEDFIYNSRISPQKQWKPTELQLNILAETIHDDELSGRRVILTELLEQLKAL